MNAKPISIRAGGCRERTPIPGGWNANGTQGRVRGTYYIDVHASRIRYRLTDHDALMALIDGVAIVD